MKFKIWIRLLIVLVASISVISCLKEPTTITDDNGFIYQEYYDSEDYIVYLDNVASQDSIVVPSTYNGHSVVAVGMYNFQTSGHLASTIELPDTIEQILEHAFAWFVNLESIVIPDRVSVIGSGAFRNCTSLSSIWIPEGVEELSGYLFQDCRSLEEISLPSTLVQIVPSAFMDTYALDSIEFRNNLNFRHENGLITNYQGDVLYAYLPSRIGVSFTVPDDIRHIAEQAFIGNTRLEEVVIPDTVETLGGNAFNGCTGLTSVDIGSGIEILEENLFYDTENLETVTLHEGLLTISAHAFYMTNGLQTIDIPASVTRIEALAFHYCIDLVSITVDPDNPNYLSQDGVLYTKNMEELIFYPSKKANQSFTVPLGVKIIRESAFEANYELLHLVLSSTVETIEPDAFRYMTLWTVFIPDSVTTIGRDAFYGYSGVSLHCEASSKPEGWNDSWCMKDQTVVWGYEQE